MRVVALNAVAAAAPAELRAWVCVRHDHGCGRGCGVAVGCCHDKLELDLFTSAPTARDIRGLTCKPHKLAVLGLFLCNNDEAILDLADFGGHIIGRDIIAG